MILFLYNRLQDNKKLASKIIDNIFGLKINIYIYIYILKLKIKLLNIKNDLFLIHLNLYI